MRPVDVAKLVLAASAAVLFAWGIRTGSERIRWIGIGCLVAAFALRFYGRSRKLH